MLGECGQEMRPRKVRKGGVDGVALSVLPPASEVGVRRVAACRSTTGGEIQACPQAHYEREGEEMVSVSNLDGETQLGRHHF